MLQFLFGPVYPVKSNPVKNNHQFVPIQIDRPNRSIDRNRQPFVFPFHLQYPKKSLTLFWSWGDSSGLPSFLSRPTASGIGRTCCPPEKYPFLHIFFSQIRFSPALRILIRPDHFFRAQIARFVRTGRMLRHPAHPVRRSRICP